MVLGLGTGSTAAIFVRLLADRVKAGLEIVGTPTSEATDRLARELGIRIVDPNELVAYRPDHRWRRTNSIRSCA